MARLLRGLIELRALAGLVAQVVRGVGVDRLVVVVGAFGRCRSLGARAGPAGAGRQAVAFCLLVWIAWAGWFGRESILRVGLINRLSALCSGALSGIIPYRLAYMPDREAEVNGHHEGQRG